MTNLCWFIIKKFLFSKIKKHKNKIAVGVYFRQIFNTYFPLGHFRKNISVNTREKTKLLELSKFPHLMLLY